MKTRICVDARLIRQSGIGTFLKSSLSSLSQASCYEIILLCHAHDKPWLLPYSSDLIVMQSPIYTLSEQYEYLKKIPSCELFWAPHFNIPLGPIRAKKRMTCICDVYHLAHFAALTWTQKMYAKVLYNSAFFLSDLVITLSEFSRSEILKLATLKPKKIRIVSPTLDFSPSVVSGEMKNFILYVGNLKPHKNLARLVKAYACLQPKEPLYIVGKKEGLITVDAQLFEEIEKNAFLKQNVHFTGYVDDTKLKELYARALFLIFPSTYEGFGYPPLEAMASSCPVVASRAASIPEVCGDAVEYIDPLSVESIAIGMSRLLNDPSRREELIQKGKVCIEKKKQQKNEIMEAINACCNSA